MKLITFQGVTCSGKTHLAVAVAQAIEGEYINPYQKAENEIQCLSQFHFLLDGMKNIFAYAVSFHNCMNKNGWVVFDHGLEFPSLSHYLGLDILSEVWNFAILIPFDEQVKRLKERDSIEPAQSDYDLSSSIFIDNISTHGVVPLDGCLPINENVKIVLEHIDV